MTIVSASTYEKDFQGKDTGNKAAARLVGKKLPRERLRRVLPMSYLTAADICITDVYRNWLRAREGGLKL